MGAEREREGERVEEREGKGVEVTNARIPTLFLRPLHRFVSVILFKEIHTYTY